MTDTFERAVIHIPVGTELTAKHGSFLLHSELTGVFYACNKVKYLGNMCWECLDNKTPLDMDQVKVVRCD